MNFNLEKRRGHLDTSTVLLYTVQSYREFVYSNLFMRKNLVLHVAFKIIFSH
jgi:hypothetical protein